MERKRVKRLGKSALAQERSIKEELIRLSTSVRNKYKALMRGTDEMERYFQASTKPILSPLQKTVAESIKATAAPPVKPEPVTVETQTEGLVETYLRRLSSKRDDMDTTYGVRADGKGGSAIGDSQIQFTRSKVYVKQKAYDVTQGLLELLFMQTPDKDLITETDLKHYKDILLRTNAHRLQYSAEKAINANRGKKYKSVISVLFPPATTVEPPLVRTPVVTRSTATPETPKSGKGVGNDDLNRLVKRLRILIMSQNAGHTGHVQEIENILFTLRINRIIA